MKKWVSAAIAAVAMSTTAAANAQDYKLITVAGYLNFYLLNLNACQDFHPPVRQSAYDAEKTLYPYLDKLYGKMGGAEGANQKMIADIVMKRRAMLNGQIKPCSVHWNNTSATASLMLAVSFLIATI